MRKDETQLLCASFLSLPAYSVYPKQEGVSDITEY